MFEWLRPFADSTLDDVKHFLLTKFTLVGDMLQMSAFKLMLIKGYSLDEQIFLPKVLNDVHYNPTSHPSIAELLTPEQYEVIARRHMVDIELYYWVCQLFEVAKQSYGSARLAQLLRNATG